MRRYKLTNEEWEWIESLLPPEKTGQKGHPRKNNRTMLNGMLWIARSGCQWRELPRILWEVAGGLYPLSQVAQ
ncbi:transposase [Oscillibacter sp.]|uniref:transposase n=1 Tax=Oscillibacter sp. TaxID=1945593 RepID=UPI0037C69859